MKRKNKKQNKVLPVILVILGLAAVAGLVFAALKIFGLEKLFNNAEPDITTTNNVNKPAITQPQPSDQGEKPTETPQNPEFKEKDPIVQYSGDDPNSADTITGSITRASVADDTYMIRVNIDQYVRNGECVLRVQGANTDYSEAARVTDAAATSTCEGFSVPLSAINDNEITITIEVRADGKQGVIRGYKILW